MDEFNSVVESMRILFLTAMNKFPGRDPGRVASCVAAGLGMSAIGYLDMETKEEVTRVLTEIQEIMTAGFDG